MNTLISPQTFFQQLRSASMEPSWLLLQPGHPRHQKLWTSDSGQFSSREGAIEIARIIVRVPGGGQPATQRSSWVADLLAIILPASQETADHVVLPIICNKSVVACLGWVRRGRPMHDFVASAQRVRDVFRHHGQAEQLEAENQAVHWMLRRSDRPVASARSDGSVLGASPTATELLMRAQYGKNHHFRSDAATLPEKLIRAVIARATGQVLLNSCCTVRFEELPQRSAFSPPLVGIEFFVEAPNHMVHPISRLTPAERTIRDLICAGLTNREIAARRGSSQATIKNQVSSVLSKLGLSRRHHLLIPPGSLPAVQLLNPGIKGVTASIE